MKNTKRLRSDQRGLAAITVTVFILMILSLIVLAYSQLSRREQRQSLDRQLSSAATYVAESGINSATSYVRDPANAASLAADPEKTSCNEEPTFPNLDKDASSSTDELFRQSCVLFDRAPTELEYSNVDDYRGELLSLKTLDNKTPSRVTFEWKDSDTTTQDFSGCNSNADLTTYKPKSSYSTNCTASILKIVLMPIQNTGSISRETLYNESFTVYARPVKDSVTGAVNYSFHSDGPETQGSVIGASCDQAAGICKFTVNGVPNSQGLYLKVNSLYKKSALKITGFDSAGIQKRLNDAQVKIDSTGKANDVVKRIQVRIPLYEKYQTAPYALESMNGICKRLNVYPGSADNSECSRPTGNTNGLD